MNGLSLCSGIGGLDRGLHRAIPTYRTIAYVENNPFCQDVLLSRMASGQLDPAPLWGDCTRFEASPWRGLVDVVHGGYPCQPFSVAGQRAGINDPRHLWPHIARIVSECEPEYCFFENVAGHLSLGFDVVARDLEALGYRVAAGLFTATEVGAPHRRQRLYLLAQRHPRHRVADPRCGRDDADESRRETGPGGTAVSLLGGSSPDVAHGQGLLGRLQLRPRRPFQAGVESGGGSENVGDSVSLGRDEWPDEAISERVGRRGPPPPRGCRPMGHPDESPENARPTPSGPWDSTGESSLNMGHPHPTRREGWGAPEPQGPDQWATGASGSPVEPDDWPPGPHEHARWAQILAQYPDRAPALHGKLNPTFVEWLMGFPIGWTDLGPQTKRVDRLKALGNAVVPQTAALAWQYLKAQHEAVEAEIAAHPPRTPLKIRRPLML